MKTRQGSVILQGQYYPLILGWESAGIIEQVGEHVKGFRPGDVVISYTFRAGIGHYAEYVTVTADLVAASTSSVDTVHATHSEGIDAVLDCFGGETTARSLQSLDVAGWGMVHHSLRQWLMTRAATGLRKRALVDTAPRNAKRVSP